ncbi:MAG TPA: PQQ-binding-like beta-propeller repeat protein [Roseiflexaceae bacterium]|nr:PQQ-binding-like beta-propeller repeat protein [Roseiflexaceae bacterium]
MLRIGALVLALLCFSLAGPSQAPLKAAGPSAVPGMWHTNGSAKALAISGDTLYIGGKFTQIGQHVSGFAAFTSDGQYDRTFPQLGRVQAIAADGAGGWFLSSDESRSDAPKPSRLLHLRADGSIDQGWIANVNGDAEKIVVDSQRVYAYIFNRDDSKRWLMAFDRTAGGPIWGVPVNTVNTVVVSGGTVYLGGFFTEVGDPPVTRKYLAAFDGATGVLKPWNPNPNGGVQSMAASGGMVYVSGWFTDINGTPSDDLVALDAVSGLPSSTWNADTDGAVVALLADGDTVYAGGEFLSANGEPRAHLAAFSAATGALTPWKPDPNQVVQTLAIDGDRVYVGVPGTPYLAAFDLATGAALPFDVSISSGILHLAAGNGTVLVSGSFRGVDLVERQNIAAVDRSTGLVKDWATAIDGPVDELLVRDSILYIAGDFTTVAGAPRPRAAAIDISTGTVTDWNPQPNGAIATLADGGDVIYAGGVFTAVNSAAVPRRFLAAFDATTGAVTSWNPNPDGAVSALTLSGTTLFAGGQFVNVGIPAVNRQGLASFDRASGALTDWHPSTGGAADSPLVLSGPTLYAVIGGRTLAIDITTGALVPWNSIYQNYPVMITAADGDVLYGFTRATWRFSVSYRFVGVDRATGIVATCGSILDRGYLDVTVRDGIVYGTRPPVDPPYIGPSSTAAEIVALQPQLCLSRTYIPSIVHR